MHGKHTILLRRTCRGGERERGRRGDGERDMDRRQRRAQKRFGPTKSAVPPFLGISPALRTHVGCRPFLCVYVYDHNAQPCPRPPQTHGNTCETFLTLLPL